MKVLSIFLLCLSVNSFAETRVYKVDSTGNTQYHQGSAVVQNNTIIKQDSIGNNQYHKGSAVIVGNNIYQRDSVGNVQYHKGSLKVSK